MKRPDNLITMLGMHLELRLDGIEAKEIYDWINHLESQIQPRKTVSDAVDYFDGVWPAIIEMPDADGWWFNGEREMCWASYTNGAWSLDVVCTREQFEAEVERRKGEEWTYVDVDGLKLKLLVDNPDGAGEIPVICEDGYYRMYDFEDLEPIKPTISKSEADAVKAFFEWAEKRPCSVLRVEDYLEQFDVV